MEEQIIPYIERSRKHFWIVIGIYFSIFINSYVFFKLPFEMYVGYLIFILLLPGFFIRFKLDKNLILILLTLFITGLISVYTNHNTFAQFVKVFGSILLTYTFYYFAILELEINVEILFKWYLKGAYYASIIGVIQFISFLFDFKYGYRLNLLFKLNKWGVTTGGAFGIRINSIYPEPSHLGSALSAAFFIAVYNLLTKTPFYLSKLQSIIIISVYVLSFSSLGQTGIFLTFILLGISYGLARYLVVLVPLFVFGFNFLYNNVLEFRERYEGLITMFTNGKFKLGKTHGSSFILYNNYTVALKNFKTNFLFGTGLGSHPFAFEKYSLARQFKIYGFNLNSADANSMFLRLMSETGLFGLTVFFILMYKGYIKRNDLYLSYHWLVSNAILVMILLNLFRQGNYYLFGFPFFLFLYYFNSLSYKKYVQEQQLLNA
jgi:hypothetical protein